MTQQIITPEQLVRALQQGPVDFNAVIQCIDHYYTFTPTAFRNGALANPAGSNNGSCKILAFAQLHGLTETATLNAFGDYYTQDVLQHPQAEDHQNIRNFMQQGWTGVQFAAPALTPKQG
ncbi:Type III effector HopPmaJ [Nitrincola lacisaponensis]|uniref:Type III effector HopPmaJ n=1 Tax=Nitrincola lacisaponensis TaxID=267850 RepID=A0A063Y2Z9_9GAMM|nr:HopJ type III effector protein [Nitrincola lacisaponensis]KDE39151.1 Type III effector HopPmaJ [Nitrincola lacisaponensis]